MSLTPPDLTTPAQTTYQSMYLAAPSAAELDRLVQFDSAQFEYAVQIQVQDPILYVYQALGAALADQSDTGSTLFKSSWGPLAISNDATFVTEAYDFVFGHGGAVGLQASNAATGNQSGGVAGAGVGIQASNGTSGGTSNGGTNAQVNSLSLGIGGDGGTNNAPGGVNTSNQVNSPDAGAAPTPVQIQHFIGQIDFLKSLYTTSGAFGTDANEIDLLARGAVFGQMLGIKAETDMALVGVSVQHEVTHGFI